MINKTEIRDSNGALLAYKIGSDLPPGLCPYSNDSDFVQVLSWNYDSGKHLQEHIHMLAPRSVTHTQEVIVVLTGSLRANVFDRERHPVGQVVLRVGECMVFLQGGHGYDILEDGTHVLEIKNGPYPGAEPDRERFEI